MPQARPSQWLSRSRHSSESPEAQDGLSSRKRKRDILSCLECRRRKVKCDRNLPFCDRCRRGGISGSCTYSALPAGRGVEGEGGSGLGAADGADEQEHEGDSSHKRARMSNGGYGRLVPITQDAPVLDASASASLLAQAKTIKKLEDRLASLESAVRRGSPSMSGVLDSRRGSDSINPFSKGGDGRNGERVRETSLFKGSGVRTQFYGASMPTSLLAHVREYLRPKPCLSAYPILDP